jgi:hypothetical protein
LPQFWRADDLTEKGRAWPELAWIHKAIHRCTIRRPSPPHAGVGKALEPSPARGVQRRQPVGLARALDGVGDAPARGVALVGGPPFRLASALALREKRAVVRFGGGAVPGGERTKEPNQDRLMDKIDRQAVPAGEA